MTGTEPVVLPSAGRHGVDSEDALHALRNPVRTFALDEEMTMVIGADRAGDCSRSVLWKAGTNPAW